MRAFFGWLLLFQHEISVSFSFCRRESRLWPGRSTTRTDTGLGLSKRLNTQEKKKEGLLLSHPDFVIVGSAYGKAGMANPQPFVDITSHFMRQANLHYWQIESQSLRTVDGMGRPQEEVEVQPSTW